jgi:hypothetical protein
MWNVTEVINEIDVMIVSVVVFSCPHDENFQTPSVC